MKILSILSLILINSIVPASSKSNYVEWYAQVLQENVFLYRSASDIKENNIYFELEPTYFVKLTGEANSQFYKAEYLDISGYIKKSEVQVIKGTPATPFLENINFRVFSSSSQQIRSVPSSSEGSKTQIGYIPLFSKDPIYYGKIEGESAIEDRTNIWYFIKFSLDKDYYGYVYSDGCDQMKSYTKNTGTYEYIDQPNFNLTIKQESLSVVTKASKEYKYLIVLISVPVLLILFMIIKNCFSFKPNKKEKAKEVKLFLDP